MQNKISISLLSSFVGLVLFFLASIIIISIYGFKLGNMGGVAMVLCLFAMMAIQISSLVAGIIERDKIGLFLSALFLIAAIAIPVVFSKRLDVYRSWIMIIVTVPIILMGIYAGSTAAKNNPIKIYKPLVILWLIPWAWWFILALILSIKNRNPYFQSIINISYGPLLTLFGPWATIVGKLVNWPNAGEFFSLHIALIMTLILIALIAVMKFGNQIVKCLTLIIFASFILIWVLIGVGQLINCLE